MKLLPLILLAALSFNSHAEEIKLSWEAPTTRVDETVLEPTEIGGYAITHWLNGVQSENEINVLKSLTHTIVNPEPGVHEFAIRVYDTNGISSGLSEKVSKQIIAPPSIIIIIHIE